MASHKLPPKSAGQFNSIDFNTAVENDYVFIIGKGKKTKNISINDIKDYIDGKSANHLIITARKQNDGYVTDRTYQQVLDAIQGQITPILRVVDGDGYKYFNLQQYGNGSIVFGAPLEKVTVNSEEKAYIPTFTYTANTFEDTTSELTSDACGVSITYTEVTTEELQGE